MYGLASEFDASRLVGCTLENVSFSVNTVHLSFAKDVAITIEACFMHSIPGEVGGSKPMRVPLRESRLMQLAGESIDSAQATLDGTLSLTFSNGHRLELYDDTPQYEAYRLRLGQDEIVV